MHENRGWESLKLGDFADLVVGATPSRSVQRFWGTENSGHPWVSIADLRSGIVSETAEYITDAGVRGSAVSRVSAGTILMSFKLTIGRVAISGTDLYTNEAIVAIQPDPLRVNKGWLAHVLPQVASSEISDSAVKGATLNQEKLRLLKFSVPPISEQQRIAEVIDAFDKGIDLIQGKLGKLDLIRVGQLNRLLFPDVRPAWVSGEVQDFGGVRMGRQRSPKHEGGVSMVPYLRVANVFDGYIDYSDVLTMNFTPSEQEVYGLLPGDILLNEGQSLDLVGRSAVYRGSPGKFCYQNTLVRYRCLDSLDPEFAQLVFHAWLKRGYFSRVAFQTTSIAHLGGDRFARMKMDVPPLEEQRRIVSIVRAHDERIAVEKARLEKLRKLKAGLMDDLLTGRVRVDQLGELPV